MAFNGAGLFVRLHNWVTDAAGGIKILASRMDAEMDGMATGLSTCLLKDGQQTATADQPMGGFKHTGVATAVTARTHYTPVAVFQDGGPVFVDGGGTADAITATYSPAITAVVDGMELRVRATAANATTTPTFAPNGLTARTITKNGLSALVAGDIAADGHELILRYHATGTGWELLNPATALNAQPLDADLTALAAIGSSGLLAHTGAGTASARTLTAAANGGIGVSNGDGVSGNPTVTFDIGGMTAQTVPAATDELPVQLTGSGALKKMTRANFLTGIQATVNVARYHDSKASGTNGGTSVADTWTKSTLTEDVDGGNIATVASSVIAITNAGTYLIEWAKTFSGGSGDARATTRLRNTSDGTTAGLGVSTGLMFAANENGVSVGSCVVTIAATKNFELQYYHNEAITNVGLGAPNSTGENEMYAWLNITQLA